MKRSTKRLICKVMMVILLPLPVVYTILKRLGVISYLRSKIEAKVQQREEKRADLRDRVTAKLHCSNVTEYPAFWMGNTCAGSYNRGVIKLNAKVRGVDLVETLFHEDRHFQQEQRNPNCFEGYIKAEDDYKGYIRQHVEKDARRYAYVQTMRYAKEVMSPIKFMLFVPLYRLSSHPWEGVVLKKYRA